MNKADIAKRNMDKITYTNNDINFLLEWRDRNQDLVRMGVCPIKAIKIISIESGITLTCIRRGQLVKQCKKGGNTKWIKSKPKESDNL